MKTKFQLFLTFFLLTYICNSQHTYLYSIDPDQIYVPKTWINKKAHKERISADFQLKVEISYGDERNWVSFTLESKTANNYIEGFRGGAYAVYPKKLCRNPMDTNSSLIPYMRVNFVDKSGNWIHSSQIKGFEDILLEIFKNLPFTKNIASASEKVFRAFNVGSLEDIPKTGVFGLYSNDYLASAITWESQYTKGRIVEAHQLNVGIPCRIFQEEMIELIKQYGMGVLFVVDLSNSHSRVGILFDNIKLER